MKISKLFHTLYAFLMFLPVMVLPLFAININQKEVEPLNAQIEETQVVDFNQYIPNNTIITFDVDSQGWQYVADISNAKINDIYILKWYQSETLTTAVRNTPTYIVDGSTRQFYNITEDINLHSGFYNWYFSCNASGDLLHVSYWLHGNDISNVYFKFQLFNLTQMFGSGNEPTLQQFNDWYPNDYYLYTSGRKEILHTGVIDTLNNTDIGSQFLYSLYNPLKDYFNLPNYMNLGGLYDWFLLNLFSGYNSPVYFIIFDLMIYWLAMSILWLIFDVLMYVPSMIHKMLDKARME